MNQSQESLYNQLEELIQIANMNGLYDAADLLKNMLASMNDSMNARALIVSIHDFEYDEDR